MLILAAAVFYDLRNYRIPNALIVLGYLLAGSCRIMEGCAQGITGMAGFPAGILLPVISLILLQRLGVLGGGDIKLLSVAGGFLGVRAGMLCVLLAFLIGGILSFVLLVRRRILRARICYFLSYIQSVIRTGKCFPYYDINRDGQEAAMHFSIAVLLSAACILWPR